MQVAPIIGEEKGLRYYSGMIARNTSNVKGWVQRSLPSFHCSRPMRAPRNSVAPTDTCRQSCKLWQEIDTVDLKSFYDHHGDVVRLAGSLRMAENILVNGLDDLLRCRGQV